MSNRRASVSEAVRVVLPLLILAVGFGGFLVLKNRPPTPVRPQEEKRAPLVDTAPVVAHAGSLDIETDGQVVPFREIALSAEVAGRVVEKAEVCRAGKFVRRGDLLLTIDPRDYRLEKKRLSEELIQSDVSVKELDVEIENTGSLIKLAEDDVALQQAELNRQNELLKQRATSRAAVDQAKRSLLQSRNSELMLRNQLNLLNTRRSRVQSAKRLIEVRLEQAELDLERTAVKSPIDGIVVTESVELDSFAQKGTPLVTIEDTSAVEVRCNLRMDELYWIWNQEGGELRTSEEDSAQQDYQLPKTDVTVVYRLNGRDYAWEGVLWRYDGIGLDEKTRTVPCRILVQSPRDVSVRGAQGLAQPPTGPPALVRGMFVAIKIHAKPRAPLLRVPEVAVQPGWRVFRVRDDWLHFTDVRVVEIADAFATVQSEDGRLRAGDDVVVSPVADIVDGMLVRPRRAKVATVAAAGRVAPATETRE